MDMRISYLAALAAAALAFPLAAQDAASDEDLFGSAETSVEATDAASIDRDQFLVWEAPRLSGRLSGSVDFGWSWADPWSFEAWAPDESSMDPALSSRLFLQAKPEADWGYYAALDLEYPFALESAEASDGLVVPNLSIYSLYSTFSWEDALFFTFGKQPLRLGVGRFFQPADDLVSLSEVDVSDPTAEREGPLAFTALWTIPKTLSSASLWAVFPKGADSPDDAMFAAKYKYFFGDTELALAGAYKYDAPPSAFLLLNSGLWDLNVFGEFQLKYGSERTFLEKSASAALASALPASPFMAVKHEDRFFANATIGATYANQETNLTLAAQYFWNGEAQQEADAEDGFAHFIVQSANEAMVTGAGEDLFAVDNLRWSAHYGAASASLSELFVEELSVSLTVLASLTDLSGLVMPEVSYELFDFMTASLSAALTFGDEGDEYTMSASSGIPAPGKPSASVTLGFTVGSGSF